MNLSSLLSSTAPAAYVGDIVYNVSSWNGKAPDPTLIKADSSIWYSMTEYPELYDKIRFRFADTDNVPPTTTTLGGTAPGAAQLDAAWSPDGRYVVTVNNGLTPLHCWDFSTGSPVKLTGMPGASANAQCVAWSPDSRYLAIGYINGTRFRILDMQNPASPAFIADPATQPSAQVNGIAWSPDGTKIALGCNGSQYLLIYDWDGVTATPGTQPVSGDMPGGHCQKLKFSHDGKYLAVPLYSGPYLIVYDLMSGTPSKLANPSSTPGANTFEVTWTYNNPYMPTLGYYIALGYQSTPYMLVYSLDEDTNTLSKMTGWPSTALASTCRGIDWSPDGRYVVCATDAGWNAYDFITGEPVRETAYNSSVVYYSAKFSPDGRIIVATRTTTSPYHDLAYRFPTAGDPSKRFTFNVPTIEYGWIKALPDD